MHFSSLVAAGALFVGLAQGISWALIFNNGNTWIEQTFTMTVPPPPPPTVTTGPWYFWCGVQPSGGGVVQPVLGYMASENSQVNPNPPFPEVWAMNLWALPWNYGPQNNYELQESPGIWVDQGAQILSSVLWEPENLVWVQTAEVLTGAAAGQSVKLGTPATYFQGDEGESDNTPMTVCESELDGDQTSEWDFTVTFTDVTFRASSSSGVADLCSSAQDHSDGNGFISFTGFEMKDEETCYWASIVLTPP